MAFKSCCLTGGERTGEEKEALIKLGRELHSLAVYEILARLFTGGGDLLGKVLRMPAAGRLWNKAAVDKPTTK